MLRKDNDPEGWRRVWAEETAYQRTEEDPPFAAVVIRFALGFCMGFAPLWILTELLF